MFGLGGPLVAIVGTNIGAGQRERALRAALDRRGHRRSAVTEIDRPRGRDLPAAWLACSAPTRRMLEAGAAYLRMVGPVYGFFGLGMALYFASQGAGRLLWPLLANLTRLRSPPAAAGWSCAGAATRGRGG